MLEGTAILSKVERFCFFPIVIIAAFIGAFILLLAIVGCLIFVVTYDVRQNSKANISFSDVLNNVYPEKETKAKKQTEVPQDVERYFGKHEKNRAVLEKWLDEFKTDREKKVFLKNLSEIIIEAEKKEPEKVYEYTNAFWNLKTEKMRGIDFLGTELKLGSAARNMAIGAAISAILFLFTLFTLINLLLLLLSIEKNTRGGE